MDDRTHKSFWNTLPGLLTAVAAVLTAAAALISALLAAGIIHRDSQKDIGLRDTAANAAQANRGKGAAPPSRQRDTLHGGKLETPLSYGTLVKTTYTGLGEGG